MFKTLTGLSVLFPCIAARQNSNTSFVTQEMVVNYNSDELYTQLKPPIIAAVTQETAIVSFFFLSKKAKVLHDNMCVHVITVK